MARRQGLRPTELSKRVGVTIRAMRLYEQHGLLTAERDSNGWRRYEPEAVSRLHYILSLKRIGLSLKQIRDVLAAGGEDIEKTLGLQEEVLTAKGRSIDAALDVVRTARARLEDGEALSPDLMLALTKHASPNRPATWVEIFKPLARKHLSPEQMKVLEESGVWQGDQEEGRIWTALIEDARALIGSDPSSSAAFELVRRWRAAQNRYYNGDGAMASKLNAVWRQATSDPEFSAHAPVDAAILDFISAASLILRAREAEADGSESRPDQPTPRPTRQDPPRRAQGRKIP